ncbi:hypothetical protein ACFFGT_02370 [Mucilaginibacter angelicae]|uniref:Uncharacterized protein n=1 Tax=Mucilaginibacter angelicae TaxID=869718 RepID=A0ABV6KZY3_9SPHI
MKKTVIRGFTALMLGVAGITVLSSFDSASGASGSGSGVFQQELKIDCSETTDIYNYNSTGTGASGTVSGNVSPGGGGGGSIGGSYNGNTVQSGYVGTRIIHKDKIDCVWAWSLWCNPRACARNGQPDSWVWLPGK